MLPGILATTNKIILLCLPLHATHMLQPLDIGVFGPVAVRNVA
jgi:hypothetical protein